VQTFRTAVYGPIRTVAWQRSVGDRRPYADQVRMSEVTAMPFVKFSFNTAFSPIVAVVGSGCPLVRARIDEYSSEEITAP
jgi:hypothetical protein